MDTNHEPEVVEIPRPYGRQTLLTLNTVSTVKIISINPNCLIGRHSHTLRDELWTVIDGPLSVEVDGRQWVAEPGDRVWIQRGVVHRVANNRNVPARLLEVAFGVFSDSDIVRLEPSIGA
ncbi:phosphomannose isomerase type II C-terminal cupin domain [Microbacterium enclense]|uniref:phosphomannose isomerase type II C-terminal cupin domain n=1 Tax=Microbacterium enclense TaxID=993073 RepID=UPI003F7E4114